MLRLEDPDVWDNTGIAQKLGQERSELENITESLDSLESEIINTSELFDLIKEENDLQSMELVEIDIEKIGNSIGTLEFRKMFSGPQDKSNAFVDIQSGSGGTEAQDWSEMLLRMYLRWADNEKLSCEIIDRMDGEVAGLKSATFLVKGNYAFGKLRTETGVHRLVRKSPFDSGNRRHTSFASVFVYPEIDESIEIDVNPGDLRIDTYRASGAGGQHVNRTDSAVRITHIPSGIVVQCQNDRSQHRNRAEAMLMLKSKLYDAELRSQKEEKQKLEDNKSDIGWGSQIRSYVLDQSRIKDLRTGIEITNTQKVLDGEIDPFIKASLKAGI